MPSLLVGFGIGLGFQFLGLADRPVHLGAGRAADLDVAVRPVRDVRRGQPLQPRRGRKRPTDLGASAWQRLRHVTLPILLPGILGVAMGAFTLSYDEYARTTLTIGPKNTLPLEIYALISSATSPTLFAIGTLTTAVSFLAIIVTLLIVYFACSAAARWQSEGRIMDTRFDVELVSVTKRYGTTLAVDGDFACAFRARPIAACWVRQRLRQDHDVADDRGA